MSKELKYEIKKGEEGKKLRQYLHDIASLSSRLIKDASRNQRVRVNGSVARMNYVVKEGDVITFEVSKEESQNVEPQKMNLDILFEDEDVIVVNKPSGMVVHPTKSYYMDTLANGLLYHFRENGESCIVRLVSRLDMDTSGIILVAKNQYAHMALARDMVEKQDQFEKSYISIAHGHLNNQKGTIDLPIYKSPEEPIRRMVDGKGQKSITHYEVMESFKNGDMVKLILETGRTHQIRVHLSHMGNAIYGDSLYCAEDDSEYINRQALHATRLVFPHPRSGKSIELQADLPEDIKRLINILRNE